VQKYPIEPRITIEQRQKAIDALAADIVLLESTITMLQYRGCLPRTRTDLHRMLSDWEQQIEVMRDHQAAVNDSKHPIGTLAWWSEKD
jgi:hypothetical protein